MSGPHRHSREKVSRKIDGRVYLLHFTERIGSEKHSAGHYLGWTKGSVPDRVQDHKDGRGARLTQVANEQGIEYYAVQDWPGNRDIENQLKLHSARRLCPECTPSPRVPEVIQKALKREERSKKYYAAKEKARQKMREVMARTPTQGEKHALGAQAASGYVTGMLGKGMTADQMEEKADSLNNGEGHYRQGFDSQINSDLQLARELEQRDEAERERMENAPPEETYRNGLTAIQDRAERINMSPDSWLPTARELEIHPAYTEREAG